MSKDETPVGLQRSPARVRDPERSQRMLGFVLWFVLALIVWMIRGR